MTTWLELSKLKTGDRVRFEGAWDIFPEILIDAGTVGEVIEQGLNEMQPTLFIKPDAAALREALKDYDGLIYVYGPDTNDTVAWHEESPLDQIS